MFGVPIHTKCNPQRRVAGMLNQIAKKTMEKIVCIGERSWQRLLQRVDHLSALAQRLERRLAPPQDDG